MDPLQCFDCYYGILDLKKNICIIDIHGGFYVGSDKKLNYPFATYFLNRGFDFLSLNYRLNSKTTETKEELEDIATVLNYIFNHKKELHIDNDTSFYLMGDSSGAHLALYVSEALSNGRLKLDSNVFLNGVLLNCPSYDYASYSQSKTLTHGMKRWMLGKKYKDISYLKIFSPKTYIKDLNIPIFISTSKYDFLRNQSLLLIQNLTREQIHYTFKDIDSENKDCGHVHNVVNLELKESIEVNDAMTDFMVKHKTSL